MIYRIEVSNVAEAEADKAFLWMSQIISTEKAKQCYQGLLNAIESLSEMTKRCPLARENESFSQEIRQLLYGRGRNSYRVLFGVLEEASTVRILHIRHAAQQSQRQSQEKKFNLYPLAVRNGGLSHAVVR